MFGGTNRRLEITNGSPDPESSHLPPTTVRELGLRLSGSMQDGRGVLMASGWPMHSYLELWALPKTVPYVRRHTRRALHEWGLDELSETVELLVSEIITNAVHASAEPADGRHDQVQADGTSTLLFWLTAEDKRTLIQVWDSCERKPQRHEPGLVAQSGRGLLLVEALSAEWGSYVPNGWAGKVVWALVEGALPPSA